MTVVPGKAVPRGRFPHVKVSGGFAFVSGTSSRRPDNTIAGASVDALGTVSLDIPGADAGGAGEHRGHPGGRGGGTRDLVSVTTYLVSMNDFGGYNEVYGEFFDESGPTRTTVAVHQLPHPQLLIEISAVAAHPTRTQPAQGGVGMANLESTNFPQWIEENKHLLKPPVGNKQMFPTGDDFITMVVGGPNQRTDFHVDPYEEFFYQIKGTMHVDVMTDDGPRRVDINEGEMWVLPRSMPHSPQRDAARSAW